MFRTIQVWATLLSDKPPRVVLNFVLLFFQRICERFYCFPSNKSGTISAQWEKVKGGTLYLHPVWACLELGTC